MIEHVADLLESVHIPLPISFADSSTVRVTHHPLVVVYFLLDANFKGN